MLAWVGLYSLLTLQLPRLQRVERRQDLAAAVLRLVVAEHVAGRQRLVEEGRQQPEERHVPDGNDEPRRGGVFVLLGPLLLVMVLEREDDEVREKIGRFVGACGIEERFEDVENRFARLEGAGGVRERNAGGRGVGEVAVDAARVGA